MKKRSMAGVVLPAAAAALLLAMTGTAASASVSSSTSASVQRGQTASIGAASVKAPHVSSQPPRSLRIGSPVRGLHVEHGYVADGIPNATSPNWSGYVDTNHTTDGAFRNIAATWNIPEIPNSACPSGNYGYRLAATWDGLDGAGTNTVEQTGTLSQCDNGTLSYWAWYEMYPAAPVYVSQVNPGDQMSGYVDYTGRYWLITIIDNTMGEGWTTLQSCPSGSSCSDGSAEVVAESPGGCSASSSQVCRGTYYPLADFDYVSFHGISVATNDAGGGLGSSAFGPEDVTMTAGSTTLAEVTTTLSKDSFVDSWKAST